MFSSPSLLSFNMSKVPLHAIPGFVAAARFRNLTRAAASLHVTVSALSHQVSGLERQLDRKLFVRGPRGLVLTGAGEQLLQRVAPHLEALTSALATEGQRNTHALTLSVMPSVASSWLVPRLGSFVAAHPEIELNLESTTDLVDFDRQDVHAALRFGPGGWPNLIVHHLFDEWVLPVASPALLAKHPGASASNLARLPLLRDPGDRWRSWFHRFGGTPPARYVASFDDSETLHRAAVEGMGVALGRFTMARPLIQAGRLVALTRARMLDDFAHYLVYPQRSENHPALVKFRTWILRVVNEEARTEAPRRQRHPRP